MNHAMWKRFALTAAGVLMVASLVAVSPAGAENDAETGLCNDGEYIQWHTRSGGGNKYFECLTDGEKTRQTKTENDPLRFGEGPEIFQQPFTTAPVADTAYFWGGRLAYGVKTPGCDGGKSDDSINADRGDGCGPEELTMELGDDVARSLSGVDLRVKCYADNTTVKVTAHLGESTTHEDTATCDSGLLTTLSFFDSESEPLSFRKLTISADSGLFGIKPGISDTKFYLTDVEVLQPEETLALNGDECVIKNTGSVTVGVVAEVVQDDVVGPYCTLKVDSGGDENGFARFQVATTLPLLTQDDLPGQFDGDGPENGVVEFVDAPVCTQEPIDESDTESATQTCVLGIYYPATLDGNLTITPDASPTPPTDTVDALDRVALFDVWTNDPSWR